VHLLFFLLQPTTAQLYTIYNYILYVTVRWLVVIKTANDTCFSHISKHTHIDLYFKSRILLPDDGPQVPKHVAFTAGCCV
jgi:hypothetical protein